MIKHLDTTKKSLFVVFCTIFIDLVGFGLIVPILPILFSDKSHQYYLLPPDATPYYSLIMYGLLLGSFPLAQFFSTPILGQLSDHYGRRKILIISLIGSFFSYTLFSIGIVLGNLPLLFVARILDGITGGNIAVAQAVISDVSTKENSTKNFGLIGGAFGLGFVLGPFIGGNLASLGGAILPFVAVSVVNLINLIFVWKFLPETNPRLDGDIGRIDWVKSSHDIWKAFSLKRLRIILLTSFLYQSGFTFLTTFAPNFFISKFFWQEKDIGNFFGYIGIWLVITQALIIRYTLRFDQKKLLALSLFASSMFTFLLLLPSQGYLLYFVAPFFSIFIGLVNANIISVVSLSSETKKQGEAIGINSSIQALAQAIPPIISGFISFGSVTIPIWLSVIFLVIAFFVFWRGFDWNSA
jgi:MFS transporter, DHA1 family, tetracycline resistance protein